MDGERLPGTFSYAEAQAKVSELQLGGQEAFAWIGLHAPTEHQMQEVGDAFSMHPLAIEDAVCAHQRPKLERYDESLFLVLKTLNYVPHESTLLAREIVETGEIMVFVNRDFVVTVRHGDHGRLSDVRKRMDSDPEHMRLGPFAVMHAIADAVVDHYLDVTQLMEGDIDAIEEEAFARDHRTRIEPIYQMKREVVELRRSVNPLSMPFARLQTEHKDLISKEVRRYLRDVGDHHTHAADADRQLRRESQLPGAGGVGPGRDAAEHRHAQNVGLGGPAGDTHDGRRHLRDELRVHAGPEMALGLPDDHPRYGGDLPDAVSQLPA